MFAFCLALAPLASCGLGDDETGPEGVTAGEAQALEDAAEMLESRRLPEQPASSEAPKPTATGE